MMKQGDLQRILADARRIEAGRKTREAKKKMAKKKKATARQVLKSKTVWINLILGAAVPFLVSLGVDIKPEQASTGLVLVNLILRAVTNQPLNEK
ncbi:MAG: hypothetical protein C4555_05135 [Dehalococcoidia bacterium]|nr:MAG: hypothetical protein C4555_05135 [Dehalococcoidia bacterium]